MNTTAGTLSLQDKLNILADAAKYDVACTSSGSDRRGRKGFLGNASAAQVDARVTVAGQMVEQVAGCGVRDRSDGIKVIVNDVGLT